MKYNELEKLKPYRIVKRSTDKTFVAGDVIWISPNGDINSVGSGWITPHEEEKATYDFEAEEAHDWEVISISGHEYCRKLEQKKMTNFEKLGYSKDETADGIAVGMLLERIRDDVEKNRFDAVFAQYVGLYKSMKEWLESEAEE